MKKITEIKHFWELVYIARLQRILYGTETRIIIDELWKCYEEQFLK